jgi:hypothetical protein
MELSVCVRDYLLSASGEPGNGLFYVSQRARVELTAGGLGLFDELAEMSGQKL